MENVKIVFCILTYKSHSDLIELLESIRGKLNGKTEFKTVIVNSFADTESLEKIREISLMYKCDFLENENLGYGQGNNVGISHAIMKYNFDFLVVCNPDTVIEQFDVADLNRKTDQVIAPKILNLSNKNQNPLHYKFYSFNERVLFTSFALQIKPLFYFGIGLNKIGNIINSTLNINNKKQIKIYAPHGSFIIFGSRALKKLVPVFDPNIFLFCEESDLARKAQNTNVDIVYDENIVVRHKEDGSMKLSNKNLNDIHSKSYQYYYLKWN